MGAQENKCWQLKNELDSSASGTCCECSLARGAGGGGLPRPRKETVVDAHLEERRTPQLRTGTLRGDGAPTLAEDRVGSKPGSAAFRLRVVKQVIFNTWGA